MKNLKKFGLLFFKETFLYFHGIHVYAYAAIFSLLSGIFFTQPLFLLGEADLSPLAEISPLLLMFFIPALGMRSYSEEYKNKTYETLLSMPIGETQIALAKYLSCLMASMLLLLPLTIPAFTLYFLGNPDNGHIAGFFIAMFFLCAMFSSITIFFSSLSSNQSLSFIFSFFFIFTLYIPDKAAIFLSGTAGTFLLSAGFQPHFNDIAKGLISFDSLLYFSAISFFFVFAAIKKTETDRLSKFSKEDFIKTVFLLFSFFILFSISKSMSFKLDITEHRIYSISKAAKKEISLLKENLFIDFYYSDNLPPQLKKNISYIKDLLKEYAAVSWNIRINLIKVSNEKTKISALKNSIAPVRFDVIQKDKFEQVEGFVGIALRYKEKNTSLDFIADPTALEYDLTSKIKALLSDKKRKLLLVEGLGYKLDYLNETLKQKLKERYELKGISPKDLSQLNEKATLLIISSEGYIPEKDLSEIEAFILKGNPAIITLDTKKINFQTFQAMDNITGLEQFLALNGAKIRNFLVLDESCQTIEVASRQGSYMVSNLVKYPLIALAFDLNKKHIAVKDIPSVTMPFSSPIEISTSAKNISPLIKSSSHSWIKSSLKYHSINPFEENLRRNEDDETGPFVIAAEIKGKLKADYIFLKKHLKNFSENNNQETSVILVSNSKFINSKDFSFSENTSLFINFADYLNEETELISLRGKASFRRPLNALSEEKRPLLKALILIMPLMLIFSIGVYFWLRRRKQNKEKKDTYSSI